MSLPMSLPMPLTIVAEKEIDRHALEEAFEGALMDVEACDGLIVSVGSSKEVIKQAEKKSVFVISDERIEEHHNFEAVFIRPVRLGHIVDTVNGSIKEKVFRQSLSPIQMGGVVLNPKSSQISYDDKSVRLTEKELAVLLFLSKNKNTPVPRQKLLDEVWGYAQGVETHTLETHIYRLRQKLLSHLQLDNFLVTDDDGYVLRF